MVVNVYDPLQTGGIRTSSPPPYLFAGIERVALGGLFHFLSSTYTLHSFCWLSFDLPHMLSLSGMLYGGTHWEADEEAG